MVRRQGEVVRSRIGYFSISEVARIVGVSPSSLRNWEKIGLIDSVRSQGRYRLFSRESIERVKHIIYLRNVKQLHPRGILEILHTEPRARGNELGRRKRPDRIGARLLRLRRQLGLTLTDAARQADISPSFLSAVERDHGNPSIATFQKLAQLYKTNVLAFFGNNEAGTQKLIRPRQRKVLEPEPGIRIELLALGSTVMEVQLWHIARGASSGGAYHHEGEEFIYLMRGTLEVWLDEVERYVMQAEDSLYFESSHAHRWKNLGDDEAVLLWVNTPPSF